MPKKFAFSFELQQLKYGKGNFQKTVEKYKAIVSERPSDILARQRLLGVCRLLPEAEGYRYHKDFSSFEEEQEVVMQIAFDYGDLKLFTRGMVMRHSEVLPSVITLIAKAIVKHGFGDIRLSLDEMLRRKIDAFIPSSTSKITGLHRSLTLLSNLMKEYHSICKQQSQNPSSEALEWQNAKVDHILSRQIRNSESDGHYLAFALNDLLAHVSLERIASFLETRLENSAFVISFISSLYEPVFLKNDGFVNDEVLSFYKRIFSKIAQSFKIEYTTTENARPSWRSFDAPAPTRTSRLEPAKVIKLIHLAKLTDSNITEIMGTLTAYAITAKTKKDMNGTFHKFLFPVGRDICQQIESTRQPPSIDEQRFITSLLSSYLTDYVKSRPPPPASDWKARTTLHCSLCSYCEPVRRFLNDPTRQSGYFPMAEKWRKHVDTKLDKSYFRTEVIRQGSPHKLYIEKTQQAMAASNLRSWIERARTARTQLNKLCRTSTLKELLGDQYRTILEHENLQIPEGDPASQALITSTGGNIGRVAQSTIPSKRPLER